MARSVTRWPKAACALRWSNVPTCTAALMVIAALACEPSCDESRSEGSPAVVQAPSADEGLPDGVRAAIEARDRALNVLTRRSDLKPDEVWVMRRLAKTAKHEGLVSRVAHWTQTLRQERPEKMALLDPAAERRELPDEPGEGIRRFATFLHAAYGHPEDRAQAFIEEFLGEREGTYVTTHQFLVLVWWEESRGSLPPALARHRDPLVHRVLEEQLADAEFSDLYAERAFLLGMYGGACAEDLAKWARVIMDAQEQDGLWGDRPWTFSYGGREWQASGATHTATLAVGALQAYVEAAEDPSSRRCTP
jgi:hypothetical protein